MRSREAHPTLLGRCGPERFGQQGPPVWRRDFGGDDCNDSRGCGRRQGVNDASAPSAMTASSCKSMEFKNLMPASEVLGVAEGLAEEPSDVPSAWRPPGTTGWPCSQMACRRGLQRVRDQPHGGQGRPQAQGQVEGQTIGSTRCSSPTLCGIGEYVWRPPGWPPTRCSRSARSPATARPSSEEAAQVKIRLTCVMDSFRVRRRFLRHVRLGVACRPGGSSPMPSELLQAQGRRRWPATSRKAARRAIGQAKASGAWGVAAKTSVGITLGLGAASFEVRLMVFQVRFSSRSARPRPRSASRSCSWASSRSCSPSPACRWRQARIVAEVGDVSRFRSAAALVSYAGLNSSVSQSGQFSTRGGPITKQGDPYLRRRCGWRRTAPASTTRRSRPSTTRRGRGKRHRVAVTAVARKLCHIVYAVMRDQVPHDPNR